MAEQVVDLMEALKEGLMKESERRQSLEPRKDRNFYFIHAPRTAGTSMRKVIGWGRQGILGEHKTRRQLVEAEPDGWAGAFRFGFVRNPYDRAVSLHCYHLRLAGVQKQADAMTFAQWLAEECRLGPGAYPQVSRWHREMSLHIGQPGEMSVAAPQTRWTHDKDGSPGLDFIGRYEDLQEGWAYIQGRLGFEDAELPWISRTDRSREWEPFYAVPWTQATVSQLYWEDFLYLGYTP